MFEGEGALDAAVEGAVEDLLTAGPTASRAAKAIVREVRGLPHESTRWHTARRIATQRTSAEGQEGLKAFLEKREPGCEAVMRRWTVALVSRRFGRHCVSVGSGCGKVPNRRTS